VNLPVFLFEVIWQSGHVETIRASSAHDRGGWFALHLHGDLVLHARSADVRSVRNLTLAPNAIGGGA
jgi:hypothetical protein